MSQLVLDRFKERFASEVLDSHSKHGDETATVKPDRLVEMVTFLRDDAVMSMEMLTDLTGVDYLGVKEPRFEVVYHFYSLSKNHRLRLKVGAHDEDPRVPSIVHVYKAALWQEREAWDLYGIKFDGHPDLRRILLYPEFKGHPLRKDYDIEERQPLIPAREGKQHL